MRLRRTLFVLTLALASACASGKQVAGRRHALVLTSCQPAVPYVVPLEAWKAEEGRRRAAGLDASAAALMADATFLAPHRVQGGRSTPVRLEYPAYPYIAVFVRAGAEPLMRGPFTPPTELDVCFSGCEGEEGAHARGGAR